MNSNSFNNKKSLSQQDGCDNHTRREKPARAYNSNTMSQALPVGACRLIISLTEEKQRSFVSVACLNVEMMTMTLSLKRKVFKFDNSQIQ